MPQTGTVKRQEGVACPFCGLFCDDLTVEPASGPSGLKVAAGTCTIAAPSFGETPATGTPRVDGRETGLEEAAARAAGILSQSRLPLFAGLAADVAGVKAALALAERTGGVVDHAGSDAAFRNTLVVMDKGWVATTLAEVRNRADLVVVVGRDVTTLFPRFFERFVWNAEALFGPAPATRSVVYIGDETDTAAGRSPDGRDPTVIPCDGARLAEVFGLMRALHNGREVQAEEVAGAPVPALAELVERMKAARYGVVVWAAPALAGPHGELAVQSIADLVTDINETTRFSCLPLGGTDNGLGAAQVCTWQSGFPLRTAYAGGRPAFDPHLFGWRRLVDSGEADALVWVSSFRPGGPPAGVSIPSIVLAAPGEGLEREPEVFIPVGVPGLDHAGHVVRTDSVASVPLRRLRESGLPRAAEALKAIAARLGPTAAEG